MTRKFQRQSKEQTVATWLESQKTCYSKLMQSKSGQAPKEMTERQNWIPDKLHIMKSHIKNNRLEEPVLPLHQHMTSPDLQLTQTV